MVLLLLLCGAILLIEASSILFLGGLLIPVYADGDSMLPTQETVVGLGVLTSDVKNGDVVFYSGSMVYPNAFIMHRVTKLDSNYDKVEVCGDNPERRMCETINQNQILGKVVVYLNI
jgi:hypothetical protein